MKYLSKWSNAINKKVLQASARASMMDKKTKALLSVVGVLGVVGLSMADGSSSNAIGSFVTCDGAKRIATYAKPLTIFLTAIILIVGVAGAAFEGFQKKYGHFIGVLLISIIAATILYSAGTLLDNYSRDLSNALCNNPTQ